MHADITQENNLKHTHKVT